MSATPNPEQSTEAIIFTNDELNEIIAILQTSSHKRTPQELEKLQNQLSKLDFFADFWAHLEPETSLTLLKQLRHEYAPRTKTVFNYGDPPNRFYLVLSGSVFAIAPKASRKKTMTSTVKENDANKSFSNKLGRSPVIRMDSASQKHLYNLREESDLVTNKELSELHPGNFVLCVKNQGDPFGEVALNFGTTRTATIVSREHTHLITLEPFTYNQILKKYKATMQKDCVEFFQATPVTSKWPFESVIALSYLSKRAQYQKNQCIYDIGDPCDNIYFIKEGEVEIVKEAIFDDEAACKKIQNRLHLNLDKAKLSHVNAIWKQQYSKLKVQQVALALLGKFQVFGTEEIAEGTQARLAKAIVKSPTAEIYVVSYQKFLEGTSNAQDLCKALFNLENNTPKNEWRESLAQQMIGTRLTTENHHHHEKAKSKFNPEFTDKLDNVATRIKTHEDPVEPLLEKEPKDINKHVSSVRKSALIKDPASPAPARRRETIFQDPSPEGFADTPSPPDSVESLQVVKKRIDTVESPVSSNRKMSKSPDRIVEVSVVPASVLPLKGMAKKKFVNMIHPEATEVKVVWNEKKKIAIDPSLVSVCLDLSPHSFQGSKVYQKRRLTMMRDSIKTPTKRNLTFLPLKTETSDISGDKSSSSFLKNIQESTPVNITKKTMPRPFEKKLSELLNMKNPKLNRTPQENSYYSMAINSMFVEGNLKTDSGEFKKKEFGSPRVTSTRSRDVQLPSIGNSYQPAMAMTTSFRQKKAAGSIRNQ